DSRDDIRPRLAIADHDVGVAEPAAAPLNLRPRCAREDSAAFPVRLLGWRHHLGWRPLSFRESDSATEASDGTSEIRPGRSLDVVEILVAVLALQVDLPIRVESAHPFVAHVEPAQQALAGRDDR